jgi:hypothetical protein
VSDLRFAAALRYRVFQTPYYPSDDFCKRSIVQGIQVFVLREIDIAKAQAE